MPRPKLTFYVGLFNLPGNNRMPMAPIAPIPGLPPGMAMGLGPSPNLARQSRRLYIGSITPEITEENLTKFFNQKMKEMNLGQQGATGDPVLAVQVNYEKNYAFVEFRSADDATAAMAFDGIIFMSGPLRIRRPKDYMGNEYSAPSALHVPGVVSTNVPDSIHKIFVGGLPTYLNEDQVKELLTSFGELKAFNLVREGTTGPSKGYAFFEYVDPEVTDTAIQSLSGMELGDRTLAVQRASVGSKTGNGLIPNPEIPYDQIDVPRPIMPLNEAPATDARILLMLNMVTPDDLFDDSEFPDLYEDIKDECGKFGAVEDLRIPRPQKRAGPKYGPGAVEAARVDEAAGVGRVYVKYYKASDASTALRSLAGRSFAGRSIIATLLSEASQASPPLSIIFSSQPAPPPEDAPPPPM
ncbi:hypothetical protein EXIGLDRAFT_614425 [Exidia glandulosa HHB12029]|uniref:Splicing factor U2AF subunit n=1 Tax=Exidia glandulosa HHB12029 TaxID=1314781 RepID=A0A165HS33_EXIGL|nr:hypothetical protein EXIGLDRAFT_614425 [Exidia glandulosa HHB12029]